MATIAAFDLSRPRLRHVARWIRDELDPLVAREGPELLRADDVLTLHDTFQALKTASSVTALDLRATGIHRAVIEISGIATRWPGRLADDCDKLIDLWTNKFGRLDDLHPFLYGRGGRLEGVASMEETSRLALLKRWQDTCPDKVSPRRARRRGNLGFHPGSWWINSLFACHAGIIDIETIDGGVCHDKYGAYAVMVIEGAELDAPTESTLTFRCGKDDRGRFRLTTATPRSREPVRVLRSHSVNSMWGPKAGVRYEGLYRVTGWAVHQPKTSSTNPGQKIRLGDTYFDIHLERCDPVPLQEVAKSPTASELDDYSEYKRLRKVHRDIRNKAVAALADTNKILPMPVKVAPIIPPPAPASSVRVSSFKISPTPSRTTTFTSAPDKEYRGTSQNVAGNSPTLATESDTYVGQRSPNALSIPSAIPSPVRFETSRGEPSRTHTPQGSRGTGSIRSTSQSRHSIKEVAPWIDYDFPNLTLPTIDDTTTLMTRSTFHSQFALDRPGSPISTSGKRNRKNSGDKYTGLMRHASSIQDSKPKVDLRVKESSKSNLKRSRNPVAKLFDGAEDVASAASDCFFLRRPRAASFTTKHPVVAPKNRERTCSTGDTPQPAAPIPVKPLGLNPLLFARRDALAISYGDAVPPLSPLNQNLGCSSCDLSQQNGSTQGVPAAYTGSLLTSLKDFIASRPVAASGEITSTTPTSSFRAVQTVMYPRGDDCDASPMRAQTTPRSQDSKGKVEESGITVAFRNPFHSPRGKHDRLRAQSCNASPQTIG